MAQSGSRSLKEIDHAEDLLSRLRLDRPARSRGTVVVEGPSDKTVLSRAFSVDPRAIFPVFGRINVLRVASALLVAPLAGVTCVADRDFEVAEAAWPAASFLVFYDEADVEAMLFQTQILERFLDAWSSAQKLSDFGGAAAALA